MPLPAEQNNMFKKPVSGDGGLGKYNSSTDNIIQNMTVKHKSRLFIFSCQSINFMDIFVENTKLGVNP